jgi:hypothetical protein
MYELMEKVANLKKALDEEEKIKEIKNLNKEIINDKELMKLLEEYKYSANEDLKNKIINNELFKKYKLVETDINILILEINKRLKTINNKGKCC